MIAVSVASVSVPGWLTAWLWFVSLAAYVLIALSVKRFDPPLSKSRRLVSACVIAVMLAGGAVALNGNLAVAWDFCHYWGEWAWLCEWGI